jgi:hypothetical protein
MESADKTAEHLEMVAVEADNHTDVAVDIDWSVPRIDCLCEWHFVNCFQMILNCLHGIVACQMGHLDKPCSLSLVEIRSSTCFVNKDGGKLLWMREVI